jgi:N-methylhydantoinase A/oxoprolinase/acetone carboxylase beta subunit
MEAVIVPARAGVFSAVGVLGAPRQNDLVRSWAGARGGGLERARSELAEGALVGLGAGAVVETSVDCRYVGQSHELTVPGVEEFHAEHQRRNGYSRPDAPVEAVAVRARASVASPVGIADLPDVDRQPVVGPTIVAEPDCTIWVPEGWRGQVGAGGSLVLRRS